MGAKRNFVALRCFCLCRFWRVPVRHRAELSLDPSKANFRGSIQIALQVQKPVQTLWLNAHQIKVLRYLFWGSKGSATSQTWKIPISKWWLSLLPHTWLHRRGSSESQCE